jgi:DNA-binding transcriptional MerR regulator
MKLARFFALALIAMVSFSQAQAQRSEACDDFTKQLEVHKQELAEKKDQLAQAKEANNIDRIQYLGGAIDEKSRIIQSLSEDLESLCK